MFGNDCSCSRFEALTNELEFIDMADKRNHDFRLNGNSFLGNITSSFDNRTSLHFSDFGEHIAQPATTETKHGV